MFELLKMNTDGVWPQVVTFVSLSVIPVVCAVDTGASQ